jgi:hypothetical protein
MEYLRDILKSYMSIHRSQSVECSTYSQEVIVLAQIHSTGSNRFTIESYPPDARYLHTSNYQAGTRESACLDLPTPRIHCKSYASSNMGWRSLSYSQTGKVHNTESMFRLMAENDAIASIVEYRCTSSSLSSHNERENMYDMTKH